MSKRNRTEQLPAPRAEVKAHARGERHRVNTELHNVAGMVAAGIEPDDVVEPGPEWKPEHHHDVEKALKNNGVRKRHWKVKDWKRRTLRRKARAEAFRHAAD
jgi:hypothetical protein